MPRAPRTTGHNGPPPKPNARRRNKRPADTTVIDVDKDEVTEGDEHVEIADAVAIPPADPNWHPKAIALYQGLVDSATARIYEPSDWQTAQLLCEDYSRELKPRKVQVGVDGMGEPILVEMEMPMPGAKVTAILRGLSALIATEGDRRRLQIEVKRRGAVQHGNETKTIKERVTQNRLELLQGGQSGTG